MARETKAIAAHSDQKAEAARRYRNARGAAWFKPVIAHLKRMAGTGERCMFCSGSEASDVEHYRPKSRFPTDALKWGNYLWSCTVCNRAKGDHFPPESEPGGRIINPAEEDPWEFFFLDEFGLMTPRYDVGAQGQNQRAISTRDILDLNRDAVQECRYFRLRGLKQQVRDLLKKIESDACEIDIQEEVSNWREEPLQPDVADYFLRGPGKEEEPFRTLFKHL